MAALIWFLPNKNYYISYMMNSFQKRLVTLVYIDLGFSSVIPYMGKNHINPRKPYYSGFIYIFAPESRSSYEFQDGLQIQKDLSHLYILRVIICDNIF